MRHIDRELLQWLLVAALGTGFFVPSASAAEIDFTTMGNFNGPLAHQSVEIEAGGDHPSLKPRQPERLPLEVTLLTVSPTLVSRYTRPIVDAVLRNTGMKPVMVPSSRNDLEVLRGGNREQTFLRVNLRMFHTGAKKYTDFCVGVAVGSASVSGSMVTLAPGDTVFLHGVAEPSDSWWPLTPGFVEPDAGVLDVKVVVTEEFLDDSRLRIKSRAEAVSDGGASVLWTPTQ